MNDIQKHLVVLLKEIDDICNRHSIPYVICGRTAKDAWKEHKFVGEYVFATLLMNARDFKKFRKIVNKEMAGRRAVESILDYPDFPDGRAMRYVDEETTFMYGHLAHKYRHRGFYITIQQCRFVQTKKHRKKLIAALDKVINGYSNVNTVGMGWKKRLAVNTLHRCGKLFGEARMMRGLIGLQNKLIGKKGKNVAYIRPDKDDIVMPASMLTKTKRVIFEGEKFLIPNDHDAFIKKTFSATWASDEKPEPISSPHLLVTSTEVSYKTLDSQEVLDKNRHQIERMTNERSSLASRIKTLRTDIEKNWVVLFMTRERYRLFNLYKPLEETILAKAAENDTEWLDAVMADYLATVKEYAAKGWPLQISPALDALAVERLKHKGEAAAAKQFANLLATVKMKPITLVPDEQAAAKAQAWLEELFTPEEEETEEAGTAAV